MICKYCGKDREIESYAAYIGGVCKDCEDIAFILGKKDFQYAYDFNIYLNRLGLIDCYYSILDSLQRNYPVIHFKGFGVDSKLRHSYYLKLVVLTEFKTPEKIEIRIVKHNGFQMLKIIIKSVKNITEFYFDKDENVIDKSVSENKVEMNMDWAREEFVEIL